MGVNGGEMEGILEPCSPKVEEVEDENNLISDVLALPYAVFNKLDRERRTRRLASKDRLEKGEGGSTLAVARIQGAALSFWRLLFLSLLSFWPFDHLYFTGAMADSDSYISWQSGDPRKYWWIGGDHPHGPPPESEGAQSDQDEPAPTVELPGMMNDASTAANPRVLELKALTRDLTDCI